MVLMGKGFLVSPEGGMGGAAHSVPMSWVTKRRLPLLRYPVTGDFHISPFQPVNLYRL